MFHFDRGLKLTGIDLAIDVRRRQPRGFISHAHADHLARHELVFCTPDTARLCEHRLGPLRFVEMPYGEAVEWGAARLTTFPAGHVLGSAMLLAETDTGSLLYSGDFKLGPTATATVATPPRAEVLVMESTYGDPRYRLPPREQAIDQLVSLVQRTLSAGRTPVVHAYVLGKAQEVTRILTDAGVPVLQHPLAYEVSQIYEACGCSLGNYRRYERAPLHGWAVVAPPQGQRAAALPGLIRSVSIGVTGWAVDGGRCPWLRTEHAIPLSDHADYDQLIELVELVGPRKIYCTHGPTAFAARLRALGFDAETLDASSRSPRR